MSKRSTNILNFLAWSGIFAVIYSQSPLYSANQNTYFLHGLAQAGLGHLKNDWLANTLDSLPVFTALVYWTYSIFRSGFPFYIYYALQMGVYFFSLFGIADELFGIRKSRSQILIFITAFLLIHSAAFHFLLSGFLTTETPFLLESGVASQRLLGPVFQPSTFGVFLVLSVSLFLRGKYVLSIVPLAVAIYFHPVYLLTGAFMVIACMWVLYRSENLVERPLMFGALALGLVLPALLYTVFAFWPTSPEISRQANDLLINFRIPHHTIVAEWLDWTVAVQIGLILVTLYLTRKTKLFSILVILFTSSLLLTIAQVISRSDTLALLYPWRISALLVPISTSIILAFVATRLTGLWKKHPVGFERFVTAISFTIIIGLVAIGWTRFQIESDMIVNDSSYPIMKYVATHNSSQDTYIIPPKLRDFRLVTGVPVYIDVYSIPYHDTDFLEWYRRVDQVSFLYYKTRRTCDELLDFMKLTGTTHFILPADKVKRTCLNKFDIPYQDEYYLLLVPQESP